jgi:hypothetical protein
MIQSNESDVEVGGMLFFSDEFSECHISHIKNFHQKLQGSENISFTYRFQELKNYSFYTNSFHFKEPFKRLQVS